MKVYIITTEPYPNGMAATNRIKCYAQAFLSQRIDCQVVIAKRTEVYGQKLRNIVGVDKEFYTPFSYIGGTPIRSSNILIRRLYDYKDRNDTLKYIENNICKGDVIITYMREDPMCVRIIRKGHKIGAKVIRDLCELPYGTGLENTTTAKKRKDYMRRIFPLYDGAICISESLYDLAKNFKSSKAKLVKVPILVDENEWNYSNVNSMNIEVPYLFHSGSLQQQKDGVVDALIAFGKAIKHIPFQVNYYFTGKLEDSPDLIIIQQVIQEYSLEGKIQFLGYLSDIELKSHIKSAKGFVVNKMENLQNNYCFATKLGEYLLSGNPVITTNVGEARYYLQNGINAIIVEQGNIESLSQAIIKLFLDEFDNKVGINGQITATQNFTTKKQGQILKKYLNEL